MKPKKLLCSLLAALFAVTTLYTPLHADEGMWPFNIVPRAEIKRRYGFDLSDAWLRKVQLASVRFNNGGSGSFVSPDGLVLTNHHIAADTLQKLSAPQKDLVKEGFYARTRAEELKAPDLELNVLVSLEDVTNRVNGAMKPGASAAEAQAARAAAISVIEEESQKATNLRSDVVTLYQGGQYNLYRYKKYTDVRLVFAPELGIAFFGGDPDNFMYPRYCLDMALFRVYENNQPARIENHFKWAKTGAKEGDLVFVSGHPGTTQRLNTMAHLEYFRDTGYPLLLRYLERQHALLKNYSQQGVEQARRAQEELFSIENALKSFRGQYAGLRDKSLIGKKQQAEDRLRASILADQQKQKEYGAAWDQIAQARKGLSAYERDRRFLESAWGFNSTLFNTARSLVRLAAENERPNAERLPEYTDARRASLELQLYSPAPIYEEFERMKLADSLRFMRGEYGANHPLVERVLNGKPPEERAAELIASTRLKDVSYRKELAAGGRRGIEQSTDPMIVLARAVDEEARKVRKRYEEEVTSVERGAYAKIARALFATEGTKLYPDATFTLRLSYGAVRGYEENGKQVTPFTRFAGLFERAAQHGNQPPYQLPARWTAKKEALNLRTPFNFVSTADIIGGNSGSPVINRDGELVGLIFDGNIQSLVGNFIFDETQNRSISVDSRGMIEAL
nr:S46 family peptidase [Pyrinomonadaceae bacterium]